jgi:metal-responsive CopG/Arc/MetJ family transcriptional regulator
MRALVDVPDDLLKKLEKISNNANVSRAEIIRRALREFANNNLPHNDGFGIWANNSIDGLVLQENLRDEW